MHGMRCLTARIFLCSAHEDMQMSDVSFYPPDYMKLDIFTRVIEASAGVHLAEFKVLFEVAESAGLAKKRHGLVREEFALSAKSLKASSTFIALAERGGRAKVHDVACSALVCFKSCRFCPRGIQAVSLMSCFTFPLNLLR